MAFAELHKLEVCAVGRAHLRTLRTAEKNAKSRRNAVAHAMLYNCA